MARRKSGWRIYNNAKLASKKMLADIASLELKVQAALSREDFVEAAQHCLQLHTAHEAFKAHTSALAKVTAAYDKADKKAKFLLG